MQRTKNTEPDDQGLEAPERLISALQKPRRGIFVPRTVDEAILRAARAQLTPPAPRALKWLRFAPWAAGAAALLAGLVLLVQTPRRNPTEAIAREDLNRDGRVDILDAFTLAKTLEGSAPAPPTPDLNGDGRVDQGDVAYLAAEAVKLQKGGRS